MDTNNWRTTGQGGEAAMDAGNWRAQLQSDSRQRIVNKIMETLKRHLQFSGQEGLDELQKIAVLFEENIYTVATSPADYLRNISLKMLTLESNSLPPNPFGNRNRTLNPGAQGEEPVMNVGDWRAQLQPDSRQRIVNKIMNTLKKHLPFSGQEGLEELKKIAVRFEEKIYTAATSQSDYLRKISLKMLTMESKSLNDMPNSLPSNPYGNSNGPPDAEDGYTWRKYGGRRLKGNQMSRSYYRCTYPNCPTKKKVVRSLEGHVIEVIYEGLHIHPKARSLMRSFSVTSSTTSNDVTQVPSPITNDIIDQDHQSFEIYGCGGGQVESDTTCENSWDDADLDSQSSRSESDEFDEIEGKKWQGNGENEGILEPGSRTKKESRILWSTSPFLF